MHWVAATGVLIYMTQIMLAMDVVWQEWGTQQPQASAAALVAAFVVTFMFGITNLVRIKVPKGGNVAQLYSFGAKGTSNFLLPRNSHLNVSQGFTSFIMYGLTI